MRIAPAIALSPDQGAALEQRARSRSLPARVVERARIVLLAAEGRQDKEIAASLKMTPKKVSRWRKRFLTLGMAGLERDAPRPGRTPTITASLIRRVVTMTTRHTPPQATHWSTRSMARTVGISEASVRRIWRSHGLKPHRIESFKISTDPDFAEKLEDVVGLYLNPPEHALVLCVDEKSQIQALDRTQPGLPLKRGRSQTLTHDYKRHGTATLFAALNAANGEIYGLCQERHRHQEWLKFLRLLDQTMPAHLDLHLVADNYATHKHPKVQRWFARHPRYHMHFSDQHLVAEHGGTFLPRSHPEPFAPRSVSRSRRTHPGHRRLHRPPQPKPQALHLDGSRLRYLGEGQARSPDAG
jgi:transposase